jgi:hypothetical protein
MRCEVLPWVCTDCSGRVVIALLPAGRHRRRQCGGAPDVTLEYCVRANRRELFGSTHALEHDPPKWKSVFGKDHAPAKI